jgi:meso-butanediol dehydrogenase / (S,S)-butanediol dehydrogenase / diacetyl reductase
MNKKKYIIISGAYSDLAKNTLKSLSNYNLILIGKDLSKLLRLKNKIKNPKIITLSIDITDEKLVENIKKICINKKIKIYGAINFVGLHSILPLKIINYKNFETIYRNNVFALINLIKFFSEHEKYIQSKSTIINISSVSSLRGNKSISLYSSSKAASNNLVKSYAKELSNKGTRVNSIILGHFEKGMSKETKKFLNNEQILELKSKHPLGFGKIKSLIGGIKFLLDSENDWITGIELNIDGGYSA